MSSVAQTWNSPDWQPAGERILQHQNAEITRLVRLLEERRTVAQRMPTYPTDDNLSAFFVCDTVVTALMHRLAAEIALQEMGATHADGQ